MIEALFSDLGWWAAVALMMELLSLVLATLHILLNKRNTASALLWIVIVVLLPLIGTLIYVAFGVDRHGRRATAKELQNADARQQLEAVLPQRRILGVDRDVVEEGVVSA